MDALLGELRQRWRAMFGALARGEDLPPGRRLRAEGMAEAAVVAGFYSAMELDEEMDCCYQSVFGHSLGDDYGEHWREFAPFPENPAVQKRAPVYPSTAD